MNTTGKVVSLLFVALSILFPLVAAGTYEENIREDIFLVRPDNEYIPNSTVPTFVENEDLTFFACIEEDNVPLRLSILCDDTNEFADVPAYRWGPDNCYIGSVNLEQFSCSRAYARAEYIDGDENRKLEQEIRINSFSDSLNRIVETQFTDGGWQGPLETAYGLFAISSFPDLFEQRINQAIEYLKLNRDNDDKCWPQEDCQISTTANILFLLERAGFEDLRIQHDGRLYLEREQNYIPSSTNWEVNITDLAVNLNNSINTSCVYDYNGAVEVITLPKFSDITTRSLVPGYNRNISIVCTEPIQVDLYNQFDELLVNYLGDNFTYSIPPACWTLNNERINCDVRATLFAVETGIDTSQRTAARNYLSTLLIEDRTAGKHIEQNWTTINDALYAQVGATQVNEVIEALLYQQNNNGSWFENRTYYEFTYYEATQEEREERPERVADNVTRSIVETGYAIMALLENNFEEDEEPILDAQRFLSLVEDDTSLNFSDEDLTDEELVEEYEGNRTSILTDPKRNAMAFYVLKSNARPVIRTEPQILILNQENTTVDFINPTIFDLDDIEYELSDSLENKIVVEEKDFIGAYSFRRVEFQVEDTLVEDFGYLRLLINENEYLKIPIIIDTQPELEITLPERLTVFGGSTTLPFTVDKSTHTFDCSLEWGSEGISSPSSFNINNVGNNTYNFPVRFAAIDTENSIYNGTITCSANGVTFITPFATNIVRFATEPLEILPSSVSVSDEQNYPVTVKNLLDREIEVQVRLRDSDPIAVISESFFTLLPGAEKNVSIQYIPTSGENYSTTNSLVFSTFDIEERVFVDVNIEVEPPRQLGLLGWGIIVVSIIIVGGVSALIVIRRKQIGEWYVARFKKEDIREQIQQEVTQIEIDEQREAIRNMMRIAKLQGKTDQEVRELILGQGYTSEDIENAVSAPQQQAQEEEPQEA